MKQTAVEWLEDEIKAPKRVGVTPQWLLDTIKQAKEMEKEQVNHPDHYQFGKNNEYEAIKVIDAWDLGFSLGNTIKYISRAGKKDKTKELEDLKKASWYLNHYIKQLENN